MSTNFQKKQITQEIDKVISNGFSIDTTQDSSFLTDKPYSWDDLTQLKDELGNSILEFVAQVNTIITNPEVIRNLGKEKDHFQRLVSVFFSDINEFSHKVKEIRLQHEGRTGHINDINEFNLYNRIAITYHSLYSELSALITPTLSDLVLTISEVVPNAPLNSTSEVTAVEEVKE